MSRRKAAAAIVTIVCIVAGAQAAFALGPCSRTARVIKKACQNETQDGYYIALANCFNIPDQGERQDCMADASDEQSGGFEDCNASLEARLDLCDELGEERYDPDFNPIDFQTEFDNQNDYFPLKAGNSWDFVGEGETTHVEVLDKTKLIDGVTCIVVHDVVSQDGVPIEDTDDWYGVALDGDVWYCGEISQDLEVFDGDNPQEPELVEIEGSWKAGRDDAKPGIVMFHTFPDEGTTYRQEAAYGDAEDVAQIISTHYGYGNDPGLDQLVPEDVANLLCDDNCLVTREYTPTEPDVEEFKYYSPGIGVFLEIDRDAGTVVQLVGCNLGPVCNQLPSP